MHAIWRDDPWRFSGKYYTVASPSFCKPVQKPHPPIYLAAFTPAALKRVATLADGWLPVGIPVPGMIQMWEQVRSLSREAGRNPDDLKLIMGQCGRPAGSSGRGTLAIRRLGSADEVRTDILAVKEMECRRDRVRPATGPWGTSVEGFLECAERMREVGSIKMGCVWQLIR